MMLQKKKRFVVLLFVAPQRTYQDNVLFGAVDRYVIIDVLVPEQRDIQIDDKICLYNLFLKLKKKSHTKTKVTKSYCEISVNEIAAAKPRVNKKGNSITFYVRIVNAITTRSSLLSRLSTNDFRSTTTHNLSLNRFTSFQHFVQHSSQFILGLR